MIKTIICLFLLTQIVPNLGRRQYFHSEDDGEPIEILSFDEYRLANAQLAGDKLTQLVSSLYSNYTEDALDESDDESITNLRASEGNDDFRIRWLGATTESLKMDKMAKSSIRAFQEISKREKVVGLNLAVGNLKVPAPSCPNARFAPCRADYQYRTFDGSCNNLNNGWWGKTETPYKRLLPSEYDDGVNIPRRRGVDGTSLPNPRLVALKVHQSSKIPTSDWSVFLVYFAQFTIHDLAYTASTYKTCLCSSRDPDCNSIPIPMEDRVNRDQRCLPSARSSASVRDFNCNLGPREQTNLLTSWLDLSQIYGDSTSKSRAFRTFKDGLLRTSIGYGNSVLPPKRENSKCPYGRRTEQCFMTGDARTEHNSCSVSIHSIWIREHNRLARALRRLNQRWSDEKLYQEARRLVIAEYQHIIYSEFLPVFVGERLATDFGLLPRENEFFVGYDSTLYPQISNEFVTGAFRSVHARVPPVHLKADERLRVYSDVPLMTMSMNSSIPYFEDVDDSVFGSLKQRTPAATPAVTSALNHHLFEGISSSSKRSSLPALSINRARDHGIPSYNKYREFCGLLRANTFEQLKEIPLEIQNRLKTVYKSPEDIDLFTGLVSEVPEGEAFLGPTAACIIGKQFKDLKFGDRFYYENGAPSSMPFTLNQLDSIREVTMARILCDNTELNSIQQYPFFVSNTQWNPVVQCSTLPQLDTALWREQPSLSS
ncbi:unnamed protein product [Brachionus calyciflorus]|uniref:Chorion peroxidase n=1 Tax=Brachionus calyciflorus TaxID=104777 RepID=A0A814ET51_9BILA|nr:unnamed protein product [Brachionus calyciflorus]